MCLLELIIKRIIQRIIKPIIQVPNSNFKVWAENFDVIIHFSTSRSRLGTQVFCALWREYRV